jgi:hypothetical protein
LISGCPDKDFRLNPAEFYSADQVCRHIIQVCIPVFQVCMGKFWVCMGEFQVCGLIFQVCRYKKINYRDKISI